MKHFFKQVFVVVVGIFASFLLLFGIATLLFQPTVPQIEPNTILHISLRGSVAEHTPKSFLSELGEHNNEVIDLTSFRDVIKCACEDANIRGIYLEADTLGAGWAKLEEMREALLAFKKTGKFIVAYGKNYTQKTYYLASVADEIVLHPSGAFLLQGLHQTVFFYKNLLEKLKITPHIFRVGKYKSAVEPFMRDNMSKASKQQGAILLHSIYGHFLHHIATSRKVKQASLQRMINDLSMVLPKEAQKARLVDHVAHFNHVETLINHRLNCKESEPIAYITYRACMNHPKPKKAVSDKITVLVAEGPIIDGKGPQGTIDTKRLVADLRAVRKNKQVKAVVLRINSPGGSALASDVLWQEVMLTKACKPVVASLSDIAASGGYYMASACNQIVAQPTTITGSIGIFGLFFDVNSLLGETLGVTTDAVKTSKSADLFSNPGRSLRPHEKVTVQRVIDHGYDTFLTRVAEGRAMKKEAVEAVASGRVWSGRAAQKRGLLDRLGGIEEAIQTAAELAGIKKAYTVTYRAKPPAFYEEIEKYFGEQTMKGDALTTLGQHFPVLQSVQSLVHMRGVQARLPYAIEIE